MPPRPAVELQRRGERRVERFLDVAIEVFNEKGYQGARLSDIVKRAGGSLSTLYRAFGDKEGLVHALMERSIRDFGQGLEELLQSPLPPAQALEDAACRMVEEILTPARIVSHRIFTAEGMSQPALRDWFHAHGIRPVEILLSDYFARETRAGRLAIDDPDAAADQFYMLVFGGLVIRSISGRVGGEHLPQAQARARSAVQLFLKGALPGR
ncbi:TetR/AcrR family transcriptional regulator [Stenotrophomonas mori]|uniref:TetR/AcrR family transcriptional regulator n=1 Tax=Stenotrophomonas mori TaxID=2871096 RepID=A0ABT0SEF7_9GAMM|nr:TetR/AcrR family transcriptional regulator [Stenotrophomonas mori]MCL7713702.1 TetR/AcrR family transcriptional regulator [Stenotrophomonas mori]